MRSLKQYAAPNPGVVKTAAKLREMSLKIGSMTGYTDAVMAVVTENAAKQGYAPDTWFSPDSVDGLGRPNPYMILPICRNSRCRPCRRSSRSVTLCPIFRKAGTPVPLARCARRQAAYEALSAEKKQAALDRARQVFLEAGADDVQLNIEQLPAWIQAND